MAKHNVSSSTGLQLEHRADVARPVVTSIDLQNQVEVIRIQKATSNWLVKQVPLDSLEEFLNKCAYGPLERYDVFTILPTGHIVLKRNP